MKITLANSLACIAAALAVSSPLNRAKELAPQPPGTKTAWAMHHIDRLEYSQNSLSPGDVDKDGHTDYAVIQEGPGWYTLVLHPGKTGNIRSTWPKIIVGKAQNIEYAALGDLDGDGNLDVVGAEGDPPTGTSGVRIIWGPQSKEVRDPSAWRMAEQFPATQNRGHWIFTEVADLNGDGALDVVASSRILARNGKLAGIVWLEAPKDQNSRRDVSKWKLHELAPSWLSGHGMIFADIDGDGDRDIVDSNVDWDTTYTQKMVGWIENPGASTPDLTRPWRVHPIWQEAYALYPKSRVNTLDVNKDGKLDAVINTDNHLVLLEQGKDPRDVSQWKRISVFKPAVTMWLTRPIGISDLNGDGSPDFVSGLIHNNGVMPAGKASVYIMRYSGDFTRTENWATEVVKWSDEFATGPTGNEDARGEKWDNIRFDDVDRDGDVDIVANAEEHQTEQRKANLAVVWFENPLKR